MKQRNSLSDLQRFCLAIGCISLAAGVILFISTFTAQIIYDYDTLALAGSLIFIGLILVVHPCYSLILRR